MTVWEAPPGGDRGFIDSGVRGFVDSAGCRRFCRASRRVRSLLVRDDAKHPWSDGGLTPLSEGPARRPASHRVEPRDGKALSSQRTPRSDTPRDRTPAVRRSSSTLSRFSRIWGSSVSRLRRAVTLCPPPSVEQVSRLARITPLAQDWSLTLRRVPETRNHQQVGDLWAEKCSG